MKRVFVNEKWCLGCRLCEYYCAFAQTGESDIARALKDIKISPRIKIEEDEQKGISFAVSCRHCKEPLCAKGCITGSISAVDGVITINHEKCVGCYTCILCCPFGAISPMDGESDSSSEKAVQKCELCVKTVGGVPACVKGCPNGAILFEDRG